MINCEFRYLRRRYEINFVCLIERALRNQIEINSRLTGNNVKVVIYQITNLLQ